MKSSMIRKTVFFFCHLWIFRKSTKFFSEEPRLFEKHQVLNFSDKRGFSATILGKLDYTIFKMAALMGLLLYVVLSANIALKVLKGATDSLFQTLKKTKHPIPMRKMLDSISNGKAFVFWFGSIRLSDSVTLAFSDSDNQGFSDVDKPGLTENNKIFGGQSENLVYLKHLVHHGKT